MQPLLLSGFFAAALLLNAPATHAHGGEACAAKRKKTALAKSTVAAAEELHYDVKHVAFNLNLTNTGTSVSGNVTTTATVTAVQMPVYAFELDTAITIDSVKINGQNAPVTTTGKNIRKANLAQPLNAGQTFTAQVWYHGEPPTGVGFFSAGLNHFSLPSGQQVTYTLGDMYYASEWWPCKQDIRDKIDSVDMTLTVPAGTTGCSNGTLQSTTTLPNGRRIFAWKHRYPVKYYLITAAVAPYQLYSNSVRFADGTSMPIHNYLYDVSRLSTSIRAGIDSLPSAINLYSGYFGKYPFWTEKYGNCQAPLSGGMEHQTMTTLGEQLPLSVAVHELGHQWWGDCVSQKTWQDIWLSEGFATYCEELFLERSNTPSYMTTYRRAIHNNIRTQAGGSVYVSDTTDENRVFDNRLTYAKGSVVAEMLRYEAPADSLFFVACRQYMNTYRFGNATTEDLKNVFESVYNQPLDTFFNQWIYGEGFPSYRVSFNYRNGMVYVKLVQTTSMPLITPLFHTSVDLELVTTNGTVLRKVYNNQATQVFMLPIADSVINVRLDPYERILNGQVGAITRDSALAVRHPSLQLLHLTPNPTDDFWLVEGLTAGMPMQVLSIEGKTLWSGTTTQNNNRIAAQDFASGTYILQVNGLYAGKLLRK